MLGQGEVWGGGDGDAAKEALERAASSKGLHEEKEEEEGISSIPALRSPGRILHKPDRSQRRFPLSDFAVMPFFIAEESRR